MISLQDSLISGNKNTLLGKAAITSHITQFNQTKMYCVILLTVQLPIFLKRNLNVEFMIFRAYMKYEIIE